MSLDHLKVTLIFTCREQNFCQTEFARSKGYCQKKIVILLPDDLHDCACRL